MYKIDNESFPIVPRRIFTNTSNVHGHNLRNPEINCYVPNPRMEYTKGSLYYRGSICSAEQDSIENQTPI